MRAGKLRSKIDFYSPTNVRDEYLAFVESYTLTFSTWAEVIFLSAKESLVNAQVTAGQTLVFEIRYRTGIDETMKIKFNNVSYNIQSIENVTARNKTLRIVGMKEVE